MLEPRRAPGSDITAPTALKREVTVTVTSQGCVTAQWLEYRDVRSGGQIAVIRQFGGRPTAIDSIAFSQFQYIVVESRLNYVPFFRGAVVGFKADSFSSSESAFECAYAPALTFVGDSKRFLAAAYSNYSKAEIATYYRAGGFFVAGAGTRERRGLAVEPTVFDQSLAFRRQGFGRFRHRLGTKNLPVALERVGIFEFKVATGEADPASARENFTFRTNTNVRFTQHSRGS